VAAAYAKRALAAATPDFAFAPTLAHLVGRLAWIRGNYALAENALRSAFDDEPDAIGHARVLTNTSSARDAPPKHTTCSPSASNIGPRTTTCSNSATAFSAKAHERRAPTAASDEDER